MQKVFYYYTTKYFLFLPIFGRVFLCYFPFPRGTLPKFCFFDKIDYLCNGVFKKIVRLL